MFGIFVEPGIPSGCSATKAEARRTSVDTDLGAGVGISADEGRYARFWFSCASSAKQAYRAECELFRQYDPSDISIQPAAPVGPVSSVLCGTAGGVEHYGDTHVARPFTCSVALLL
jgi:hypothetical protein